DPLFSPASETEINTFTHKYGIHKPYFILGNLQGYKNSILFFQALNQLANKESFDIVSTGAGNQLPSEWRQYTAGCTFHGLELTDEELRLAYAGAVALVYPSKY
ncbi:MAG: glycosyltransferase family 1 protein, partial [Sphaerospermopsis kisseleviana]